MSSYFTTDQYNIVVSADKLDDAIKYLEDGYFYDCGQPNIRVHAEEIGNGLFRLDPEWTPFCGNWGGSGPDEEIHDLLGDFCEPGSYVSQRNDDYFEFSIYWMDENRRVIDDWAGIANPFQSLMDKLLDASEGKED